jgi:hypothetical protein
MLALEGRAVSGSLDKKEGKDDIFCFTKDSTCFPFFMPNEPDTVLSVFITGVQKQQEHKYSQ